MRRTRARQVARLEKLALPYIDRKRHEELERAERSASHRDEAFVVIANLALLVLYGKPAISEPLTCAWERCLASNALKADGATHSDLREIDPFNKQGAHSIAQYFRAHVLPGLPGADEREKLNAVLAKAPPWLLWLTHAEFPILLLGLKLPDLSSVCRFDRPKVSAHHQLPDGAFAWRQLPEGIEDYKLGLILGLMRREPAVLAKLPRHTRPSYELEDPINLTPRERLRALRIKEKGATSGGTSGSPQAQTDDRPELASVAAWLRAMSQGNGFDSGPTPRRPHRLRPPATARSQSPNARSRRGNNGRAAAL